MENSQLTQLLLANPAHEERTPLIAIVNYLEIAMEGALDSETRDSLDKLYSAFKSLIYVVNDLLDLTNAEKGQNLIKDGLFDLPQTIKEATDMFEGEARRKDITFNVNSRPGLPTVVVGDQRRIHQVISNLILNAIQRTSSGRVTVEVRCTPVQPQNGNVVIEMTVLDTGTGMSQSTLEALFEQLEQVSSMDEAEGQGVLPSLDQQETRVLGLGLALVAWIVRNMQGQLSVRSEEGKGSCFKISLQFPVLDGAGVMSPIDSRCPSRSRRAKEPTNPLQTQEEFMLVDSNVTPRDGKHQRSMESSRDGNNGSSVQSNKGKVDCLISAMREPLLVRSFSNRSNIRRPKPISRTNSTSRDLIRAAHSFSPVSTPTQEFNPGPNVPPFRRYRPFLLALNLWLILVYRWALSRYLNKAWNGPCSRPK